MGQFIPRGSLFIFSPFHKILFQVDVVYPGWMPFQWFGLAEVYKQYRRAHDIILEDYDFDWLSVHSSK